MDGYAVLVVKLGLYGRLAQLVERHFDVVDVRGSTPLSPTRKHARKGVFYCDEESAAFVRGVENLLPYF